MKEPGIFIVLQQITSLADQVAELEDYEALEAWETELMQIRQQMREYVTLGEIISEISDAEAHIKNYLSNQSNIIEEGGGSATARTSKPNTTNKGENTDGKNH